MSPTDDIRTCEQLLAHALAIETEAVDRYEELADQMEVHNNLEVSELFRKLAEIEGKHVDQVQDRCQGVELPHIPPWEYAWVSDESPEAPKHSDEVHYLMTPYHAIKLALDGEQRAADFFQAIADNPAADERVRAMAVELAADEVEHVGLLRQWLKRYPKPEADWHHDPDPPTLQE